MEDHGGEIRLRDLDEGGAEARLIFPVIGERPIAIADPMLSQV
jgi:nitrogen fixation/metabolism regulation signal transduction histidine kinase